ncbi:hypothetical protein BrevBR_09065 [Brevundimonas sp. BR2-1]|uniref:hypothetical protein n=1 Tax=unclassified Brevundimonas TaxID=2622653 RepID=UPI002FCBD24D
MRPPAFIVAGGLLLGGCFIPPPITGDGCPWGGCQGDPTPPAYEDQTVLPGRDPFVEGGHFRLGQVDVWLTGDRLRYRSPDCEFQAGKVRGAGERAPDAWRAPSPSIQQTYRVENIEAGCMSDLRTGDRLLALAAGRNWAPGRVGDRLWLGPATEGARVQILDRR